MNRLLEFFKSEASGEILERRFKREVEEGNTLFFDIDLEKEIEYVIRTIKPKTFGRIEAAFKCDSEMAVTTHPHRNGEYFSFTGPRGGRCQIMMTFMPSDQFKRIGEVYIMVYRVRQLPQYMRGWYEDHIPWTEDAWRKKLSDSIDTESKKRLCSNAQECFIKARTRGLAMSESNVVEFEEAGHER